MHGAKGAGIRLGGPPGDSVIRFIYLFIYGNKLQRQLNHRTLLVSVAIVQDPDPTHFTALYQVISLGPPDICI